MADRIDKSYYISRKPELLKKFDEEMQIWKPLVTERYGEEVANKILSEARQEFEALIPQMPYIGGDESPGTRWLLASVRCLAFYQAMKKHDKTAEETGKILYDAILTQVGKSMSKRSSERRQEMKQSKEKHYPEGYVFEYIAGDGIEFDEGYDFTECAALKFYHSQGADEFMPFYCYLDFPKSRVNGTEFSRTMTLAEGHSKCNHRIKTGGETELAWPPPFLKKS